MTKLLLVLACLPAFTALAGVFIGVWIGQRVRNGQSVMPDIPATIAGGIAVIRRAKPEKKKHAVTMPKMRS